MPRFAVLEHDHPELHWDFLLEQGEALQTWRLPTPPDEVHTLTTVKLPDHRKMYLDYEGPVSRGRGTVKQWDSGTFDVVWWKPTSVRVRLYGRRLQGICTLERLTSSENASTEKASTEVERWQWTLSPEE